MKIYREKIINRPTKATPPTKRAKTVKKPLSTTTELATTPPATNRLIKRAITADIEMTEAQWRQFFHELNIRHVFCSSGIDTAQPSDFVLFQVFKSILEGTPEEPTEKSANPQLADRS